MGDVLLTVAAVWYGIALVETLLLLGLFARDKLRGRARRNGERVGAAAPPPGR